MQGDSATAHPPGRWFAWTVIIAALGLGAISEAISFGLSSPGGWVPDVIIGWTCIGSGLVAHARRPDSRVGILLVFAGFAWYIGNFSALPVQPLAVAAAQLTLLYRAVLVHATLTLPTGHTTGSLQRVVIIGSYVAWTIPAAADSTLATASLSAAVVVVAGLDLITAPPPFRRTRLVALSAAVLLGAAFTVATVARAANPNGTADLAVLLLNEAAIVVVAVGLAVTTLLPRLEAGKVTDLVVEAARTRSSVVRDVLARALGDPSLEVGYWHGPSGAYLDAFGDPVEPSGADDRRRRMRVDVDERPAALLVHDPTVLESSALSDAVHTTTILAATNSRLRGDVLDQLAEVRSSRRRLILAGDAERRRLERRLDRGPIQRSQALEATLVEAASAAEAHGEADVAEHIRRARAALDHVRADLERLAQGLHPASITTVGLAAALRSLADRSPLLVEVTCEADRLPEPIELAIYYACAEAITNAVKHGRASRIRVRVADGESQAVLTVIDDGVGGADPSAGTGLRGIEDRVEALGGSLTVRSEAGLGTGLRVAIPISEPVRRVRLRSGTRSAVPESPRT